MSLLYRLEKQICKVSKERYLKNKKLENHLNMVFSKVGNPESQIHVKFSYPQENWRQIFSIINKIYILPVNTYKNETNQRTLLITTHPPIHSPIQTIKDSEITKSQILLDVLENPISLHQCRIKRKDCQVNPIWTASPFPSGYKILPILTYSSKSR